MTGRVVVDTSLAVKWILTEDRTSEAQALRVGWDRENVACVVPSWFACEITNVIFKKVRSGRLGLVEARSGILTVLIETTALDVEQSVSVRALDIALALAQPASYDCQYLALAEYLDCESWTADERFWNAARTAFPRVRWIGEMTEAPWFDIRRLYPPQRISK